MYHKLWQRGSMCATGVVSCVMVSTFCSRFLTRTLFGDLACSGHCSSNVPSLSRGLFQVSAKDETVFALSSGQGKCGELVQHN